MAQIIEVRVAGRGTVLDGSKTERADTRATCSFCGEDVDAVVSMAPEADGPLACKSCLRRRLEAITVALWELRQPGQVGLPWGKLTS